MRIFVGNLAFTSTEDDLHRLFYGYGAVSGSRSSPTTIRALKRLWLCRDAERYRGPGGD